MVVCIHKKKKKEWTIELLRIHSFLLGDLCVPLKRTRPNNTECTISVIVGLSHCCAQIIDIETENTAISADAYEEVTSNEL